MIIKPATEPEEFIQIHQLNYQTFVEEIPQHQPNAERKLVDKFHEENQYIIARKGDRVIGMVCYHSNRPFSLDAKVPQLDRFLPEHKKLAEVRLLSVCPGERKKLVTYRLLQFLCSTLIKEQTDAVVISGISRHLRLYTRIGFIPFGPLVGTPDALYQPMYITVDHLKADFKVG